MKRRWLTYIVCLALGAGCVYGSFRLYRSVSRQPLTLRIVPEESPGQRRMIIRFTNTGRDDLVLNVGTMGYFLAVIDNGVREAVVQIQSDAESADAGRYGRVITPGESLDIGDVYPDVRNLPVGMVTLRAVYTAAGPDDGQSPLWRGVVHSQHVTFEVKRK